MPNMEFGKKGGFILKEERGGGVLGSVEELINEYANINFRILIRSLAHVCVTIF